MPQSPRVMELHTPLGDDVLQLRTMSATESLGALFEYNISALSSDASLDASKLLGKSVTVKLELPDNSQRGMLETFLLSLRPQSSDGTLWGWADEVVEQAQNRGAPFRSSHRDKARCHTFLAWQDPPGRQLHQALKERLLDPRAEGGRAFVAWFRRLYGV